MYRAMTIKAVLVDKIRVRHDLNFEGSWPGAQQWQITYPGRLAIFVTITGGWKRLWETVRFLADKPSIGGWVDL
jgi:hypothetical protein